MESNYPAGVSDADFEGDEVCPCGRYWDECQRCREDDETLMIDAAEERADRMRW